MCSVVAKVGAPAIPAVALRVRVTIRAVALRCRPQERGGRAVGTSQASGLRAATRERALPPFSQ